MVNNRWICCRILQLQGIFPCFFIRYLLVVSSVSLLLISYEGGILLLLQWAEVLSADAFSAFEDAGLNDDKVLTCL